MSNEKMAIISTINRWLPATRRVPFGVEGAQRVHSRTVVRTDVRKEIKFKLGIVSQRQSGRVISKALENNERPCFVLFCQSARRGLPVDGRSLISVVIFVPVASGDDGRRHDVESKQTRKKISRNPVIMLSCSVCAAAFLLARNTNDHRPKLLAVSSSRRKC